MLEYHERDHVSHGIIKITSPEQFVPLFLAYQSPKSNAIDDGEWVYDDNSVLVPPRRHLKSGLLELLNHPYPDSYQLRTEFYSNFATNNLLITPQGKLTASDAIVDCITGKSSYPSGWYGSYFFGPGYAGYHVDQTISTAPGPTLPKTAVHESCKINMVLLVVVKAKHIPMLRARLYLKLPINLPYGDIRFLQSDNIGGWCDRAITIFKRFMWGQGGDVEHGTTSDLNKYVCPPDFDKRNESMSTADILKRAQTYLFENQDKFGMRVDMPNPVKPVVEIQAAVQEAIEEAVSNSTTTVYRISSSPSIASSGLF